MIEIGRVCIKTAGRDAAKKCVIIDILDNKFVLIDGETRRRKCNILHLEPLKDVIKIKKNASHDEVKKEFGKLGLKSRETKPKQKTEKPKKRRKTSEQLREQKEEKKKLGGMFGLKKKEAKKDEIEKEKGSSLEEKAGLIEEKKEGDKKGVRQNLESPLKKESNKSSKQIKK